MKGVLTSLLLLLPVLAGIFLGLAVLVVAAMVTAVPALFLLAGFVVFCLTNYLGLLLVTRRIEAVRRKRIRTIYFAGSTALVVVLFVVTTLLPMSDPQLSPAAVEDQRFWNLPTGSRIAYVKVSAKDDARVTPVIILHGGPGVPDMKGDANYFGQLSQSGFDVYAYDTVGRGRSVRLDDPRGYTLERDVADLEAIRRKTEADRVVLIGHSYGGTLAAAYASTHPGHVSKLVLSSPGDPALSSPGDPAPSAGGATMTFRLTTKEKLRVYSLLLPPRTMLAYALLQVNPAAAHNFAGDAEMDARFDRIYNRTRPALHCENKPPGPKLHGLGFYAHYYPQSASSHPHDDFLPDLAGQDIPTLIIKGSCDYLSWFSATEYMQALSHAQLVYLRGAGHNAYQDKPEQYITVVRAFLNDQPLPQRGYTAERPPEDYEGLP